VLAVPILLLPAYLLACLSLGIAGALALWENVSSISEEMVEPVDLMLGTQDYHLASPLAIHPSTS
jgi:Ca2+/Na+ antiporter